MMKQSFNDLMESYNDALTASGVGCPARLGKLQRSKVITRRHEELGKEQLDDAVIAAYA